MPLIIIAAIARHRAIGRGNALPWHIPEDLQHFKQLTQGHPVIMGRKTWDSLPPRARPLPGRFNIVVTRNPHWHAPGAHSTDSLTQALQYAQSASPPEAPVFVIGGGQLYAQALPLAQRMILTEIDQDISDADTFFPAWSSHDFVETQRQSPAPSHTPAPTWSWVSYERPLTPPPPDPAPGA